MKKLVIVLGATLFAFLIVRIAILPTVVERGFERRVFNTFDQAANLQIEDGLHIYVCGAGSPLYDPVRSAPCLGIVAGDRVFLIDVGAGSVGSLGPMGFPMDRLDAIYLTHLHSDHIGGLGDAILQAWVNGTRDQPLSIMGPVGTDRVVEGFNLAYALDSRYRVAHHGETVTPSAGIGGIANEISIAEATVILDAKGVRITALPVSHEPVTPALGYRIDYGGRSVTISGDTTADVGFQTLSRDVDVIFHEALNAEMVTTMRDGANAAGLGHLATIFEDIKDYHATPVEAARLAQSANADALILYHIVPMLPTDRLLPLFLKGVSDAYDGPVRVAKDGLVISLPSGSDDIHYRGG